MRRDRGDRDDAPHFAVAVRAIPQVHLQVDAALDLQQREAHNLRRPRDHEPWLRPGGLPDPVPAHTTCPWD